ncbi:DDRGK domain-containing protein 1 [Sitophilus oryzae]|uniref:DDRGK domain-containing protein 1 n=1 Tax=Sitophilus oryzae TaxID=7048 RepID=A0A6J2YU21_SITOR|nr:DDRGK domain-containing protein 1 [Sitophilus oryzae]
MEIDIPILVAIVSSLLIVVISLIYFLKFGNKPKDNVENPRAVPNRIREGIPRRAQLARNRGARLHAAVQNNEDPEENLDHTERQTDISDAKIGAKKKAKLEAKAEKKAARVAEEQLRNERKKKTELEEIERKKQEAKDKAEEQQREEDERKAKEQKEKEEYEEYLKMKEAFSVEEEGFDEGEQADEQNLLQEFVNYIKQNKVVIIEDLAAHFKLKTQSCIDRIKDLQQDDILTGVIDDRGKFIYVSEKEMEAVAKFIRQRGRVSIADLAENSNQLINLVASVN